jgi:NAT, N-acetyltransferase, of N-acetylglutamate synthase
METEIITRFLESVGQKADVDLYLKLFRAQQKESFAVICASARIVQSALDPFHFDLRILSGLGLTPVVVVGLFEPRDADRQAARVHEWLLEDDVRAQIVPLAPALSPALIEVVRETVHMNTIPLLSLEPARDESLEARFVQLRELVSGLGTRKVVFLSTSAGLEREGLPPISVVNLGTDYERLLAGDALTRRHASLLRHGKQLIDLTPHRMTATVVNPLQLLRELFTVNGAGTLIRKGSRVESHVGFESVDRARLRLLIESAFGRPLNEDVLQRDVERIYVEENYLGAAVLSQTPVGIYLTKFAVERQAQGEGIGGDLWTVMTRDYPVFFWRARPTNPISSWYLKNCDGVARFTDWHVYWRGLGIEQIEPAMRHALVAPSDFAG